jgi:hypothetical protein
MQMITNKRFKTCLGGLLSAGVFGMVLAVSVSGQVKTTTSETFGRTTHHITVESGEIVFVKGNNVIIKMDNGELRDFNNVPNSTTFMVSGMPVNIRNAKVGMKLQKQTIITTQPKVVTTVETVTGTVWQVSPPTKVILTLENGQNQRFNIPKGQKFIVDGKETDASGLRKGMKVQAQRVTEVPVTVIAEETRRTGTMPPPPQVPNPDLPILVVASAPSPAPAVTASAESIPKRLPHTASDLPLIGLLGALLCGISLTTIVVRQVGKRLRSSQASF